MSNKTIYFAGGGTGGHIYPAIAIAQRIREQNPEVNIHFFCSRRNIDSDILSKEGFEFTRLPAKGFEFSITGMIGFLDGFSRSYRIAKQRFSKDKNAVILGVGGFVCGPVCWAGYSFNIPVKILNVDIFVGKANKFASRFANEIFIQFPETAEHFKKKTIEVTVAGCPLRKQFKNPRPDDARARLGIDADKKILLVTGASSGSVRINEAMRYLVEKLDSYKDNWQIVHLAGQANFAKVKEGYKNAKIKTIIADYYDRMADLMSASDLCIGRSGAVSVAEYSAMELPVICMPYPFHKNRHQYFNAEKLVEAGSATIVDDLPDLQERAEWLWEELEPLLKDEPKLEDMKKANQLENNIELIIRSLI